MALCTSCRHSLNGNKCEVLPGLIVSAHICKYYENTERVDVAPVVHARWIEDGDDYICSNCNEIVFPCVSGWQMDKTLKEGKTYWNYCPHCGAKMDEEGNK